ncbi:succinylglutamate desuccinylase/aspartoacylase family protein [Spirochaeta dissipatitropha]
MSESGEPETRRTGLRAAATRRHPERESFVIGGVEVAPGTRQTVNLPVSMLSDHTPVTMSVHVIHGRKPGPVVFVSAGIHGDEVIGVEIIRRLLKQPTTGKLAGTLLAVPIVNAFGFMNQSRYLPDRRDLNRTFPGSAGGSLAARLAHLFLSEIVERCELGIDLHSAAVHRSNFPQIRVSPGNPEALRLASVFGAPVILRSPVREGSLRQVARERGIEILLYEAGEGLRFDEMAVRAGVSGILRVLQDRGMLGAKGVARARREPLLCTSSSWVRAPQGGLLRTYRSDGDVVSEGDVLATVSDPFGEVEADVAAPYEGIIIGRAVLPVVNEGNALFHIAQLEKMRGAEATVEALNQQLEIDPLFDEDEII